LTAFVVAGPVSSWRRDARVVDGAAAGVLVHAHVEAPKAALALTIDTLSLSRIDRVDGPSPSHGWRIGAINLPPL
jgi:hypothetical protein